MNGRQRDSGYRVVGPVALMAAGLVLAGCAAAEPGTRQATDAAACQVASACVGETTVIRYRDGHTVITRDGTNTDITTQRGYDRSGYWIGWDRERIPHDRFDRSRYPRPGVYPVPADAGWSGRSDWPLESEGREAFRQRMFDRM